MKVTKTLIHIATTPSFEPALTEEALQEEFTKQDMQGFAAELDIEERTEDHVQMMALDSMLAFAKASGITAVTYDVTYFPHADQAEVEYRDVLRRSRLGWAALAAGTCQAVLDYVVPYVNEREAFGEPISHRQAVAFMVADIKIELDGLRMILLRGTSRADQGRRFDREAALAKNFASEKGMKIGSDGVQLLGGHGFVKEHPVERWYRDLRAIGIAEGIVVL